jgi:hypothetical protein
VPPPPLLLPDATELSSPPLPPLSDDAEECVFVSGIQSYTLKSIKRKDGFVLSLTGSFSEASDEFGFLTILNFLIDSRVSVVCVQYFTYSLFQFYTLRYDCIKLNVMNYLLLFVLTNTPLVQCQNMIIVCHHCMYGAFSWYITCLVQASEY